MPDVINRPPSLSTCWAIRRDALESIGEFDAYKNSVQPEAHFAKKLRNSYRFLISNKFLRIHSVKGPTDQINTAVRKRYPQVGRLPENVMSVMIALIVYGVLPIVAVINGQDYQIAMALTMLALLSTVSVILSRLTVRKTWMFGAIALPFLILMEAYTLIRSMIAYEFGKVLWKERNICLPMYQVEDHLPKL